MEIYTLQQVVDFATEKEHDDPLRFAVYCDEVLGLAYISRKDYNLENDYEKIVEEEEEANWGQWESGAHFAEETSKELDYVPRDLAWWLVIDWEETFKNLEVDYFSHWLERENGKREFQVWRTA